MTLRMHLGCMFLVLSSSAAGLAAQVDGQRADGAVAEWRRLAHEVQRAAAEDATAERARDLGPLARLIEFASAHELPPWALACTDDLRATYSAKSEAEAIALLQEALDIREAAYGAQSARVADSLVLLADQYERLDDVAKAREMRAQAIQILEGQLGTASCNVAKVETLQASSYEARGDLAQAETLYRSALARCPLGSRLSGPEDPGAAAAMALEGLMYKEGRDDEADSIRDRLEDVIPQDDKSNQALPKVCRDL